MVLWGTFSPLEVDLVFKGQGSNEMKLKPFLILMVMHYLRDSAFVRREGRSVSI